MDARRKFGEHERRVRVAPDAAESNSSFVSAPQTSQVNEIYDEKAEHPGENRKKNRWLNIRARECNAITVLNKIMDARSR